ncbi:MAG: efflux RND transporter periplasmic adaptor subunit [Planctomycetota bacterium]
MAPSLLPRTFALAAIALLAAGCPGPSDAASAADKPAAEAGAGALRKDAAPKVLVTPLVQREMVRRISTTTVVESEREIELFPRIAGQVVTLDIEEGDRVAQDQLLASLDPRQANAARDEALIAKREAEDGKRRLEFAVAEAESRAARARITLEQAERELERKEGIAEGLLSKNELEQLRLTRDQQASDLEAQLTAVGSAKAQLTSQDILIDRAALQVEKAELDLSFTRITAPFAGIVAERKVKVGDLISTGAAILTLTDPDHVRAIVYRPQRELAFFRAAESAGTDGSAAEIEIVARPEALPDAEYTGHIRIISPTVDPSSGQFRVTIGLDQPDGASPPPLLPGMLLRLEIVTERHRDALVVPKRAVVREGEAYFVFIAEDGAEGADSGVVRRVRVTEGFTDDMSVEVVAVEEGALKPGQQIVVVGNRDLEDGDRVDAEPWTEARGKDGDA